MKTNIAYVFIVIVAAAGFLLSAEWLLYVAFAALLVAALLKFRSSPGVPAGVAKPFQAQPPGVRGMPGAPGAPALPKRKKKIRRPIIIVQPPSHSEGLMKGILDETVKHSFPAFMTPQHKFLRDKEQREKDELMRLLREQSKQIKELKEDLEDSPGYRKRRRDDD